VLRLISPPAIASYSLWALLGLLLSRLHHLA
jgi:hypothetical protein